jgi:putative flippase GtrA
LKLNQKQAFFFAGFCNTLFGYFFSLVCYYLLKDLLHIIFIGLIINFITITEAFIVYRFWVFKSKSLWIKEYLRSFLVYGTSGLLSIIGLWILVDYLSIVFWLSQGVMTCSLVIFNYISHKNFTFKSSFSDE